MLSKTSKFGRAVFIILLGYWTLAFVSTHLPGDTVQAAKRAWMLSWPHMDKVAHAILYAGLSFWYRDICVGRGDFPNPSQMESQSALPPSTGSWTNIFRVLSLSVPWTSRIGLPTCSELDLVFWDSWLSFKLPICVPPFLFGKRAGRVCLNSPPGTG